jgi:hypothetical protein
MGHERARDRHVVGGGGVQDGVDLPRGIDHHALLRHGITHEIDEVLHGPELHLLDVHAIVSHVRMLPLQLTDRKA